MNEPAHFQLIPYENLLRPKELTIPNSRQMLKISYDDDSEYESLVPLAELKLFLEACLQIVYKKIAHIFQDKNILTSEWVLRIHMGEQFMAQGASMQIPLTDLQEAFTAGEDSDLRKLFLSRVAHEVGHNLTDEENIPMLLELLFLISSHFESRLIELGSACSTGKLPDPYLKGMENIRNWLGVLDTDTLIAQIQDGAIGEQHLGLILKEKSMQVMERPS